MHHEAGSCQAFDLASQVLEMAQETVTQKQSRFLINVLLDNGPKGVVP
jgi:hypothetical protein